MSLGVTGTTHNHGARQATFLPEYARVPSSAFGPPLNEFGYHVGPIKGNLFWVTDASYQAMFLTTETGVVLVDAPPTIGPNLIRAINDVTSANGRPSTVTHLVYSHFHADHIGAAVLFGDTAEYVAHRETERLLRTAGDTNRPVPTTTFQDTYSLQVGGERLELAYHGPNHTADNIFVYAPDHDTLCVVDVLSPGWAPFQHLMVSQEIPNWIKANERIMEYSWSTFMGGHAGRLGTREDARLQLGYLNDLTASVRAVNDAMDPLRYFVKYGPSGNSYASLKHYLQDAAQQAAEPVIAKYIEQLAGVDVVTADNAYTLIECLRNDAGFLPGIFGLRQS
ncbi:MBL fold metallo-hydrolase [Streptomyces tuirus]|uniref:MBL fold metallo-hydrolase n=1 Tax=Streptomyces tuirus TaxID=68278 RepID=A0A941IZZ4_9ACTN|nr:MBL fold metallo-hydrolase [Streptomyces tuirus]